MGRLDPVLLDSFAHWAASRNSPRLGLWAGTGTLTCAPGEKGPKAALSGWVFLCSCGQQGAGEAAGTEQRLRSVCTSGKVLEQWIIGLRLPQCHHFHCSRVVTHTAQGDPAQCKVLKFKAQRTPVRKGDCFLQNQEYSQRSGETAGYCSHPKGYTCHHMLAGSWGYYFKTISTD